MNADRSRHPLLVFGDDGTEPADTAWQWIAAQPWEGWNIDVMTATAASIEWGTPPRPEEWEPEWARSGPVPGATDLRFLRVAADARVMLAEADGADLLVVGLRTHSYLRAMVTGSTTEWLLHHPPAPMVVAGYGDPVGRAMVCVDGSEHATVALEAFADLPLARKCRVTVLGVADGRTDADLAVANAAGKLDGRVADISTVVREGHPTSGILDALEEARPELVVLGTRGLTGWQRLRLGSTASAVVRTSPCASLVASTETR